MSGRGDGIVGRVADPCIACGSPIAVSGTVAGGPLVALAYRASGGGMRCMRCGEGIAHKHADAMNRCVYEHRDGRTYCDHEAAPHAGAEGSE